MNNVEISDALSLTAKLMELHEVNAFKVRSVQNAAFAIKKMDTQLENLSEKEVESIKGIGKGISQKIKELLTSGTTVETDELIGKTPSGVIEMLHIKGIGPKKVAMLWKQLEVESPGELLYACNENRLIELKGFGAKTQEQIKKYIEFAKSNEGYFHYASVINVANELLASLMNFKTVTNGSLTGAIRRKCEVIAKVDLIIEVDDENKFIEEFKNNTEWSEMLSDHSNNYLRLKLEAGLIVEILISKPVDYISNLFISTGSDSHIREFTSFSNTDPANLHDVNSELDIYKRAGLQFIEPELREGLDEVKLASKNKIPQLISFKDLKGSLHNHSTYSDGGNTLEEMALACKEMGYQYLGICDHSKSAFYANGLSEERVMQQHREIDQLNQKLAPFVIFKGIESDILHDGSLDYNDDVLSSFDFIVASVHSGLKMSEEKATQRILKAVANPFTTILGHPTGRLLLAREGYPIDHKAVIEACAEYDVVIELNAHPYRLDLDWRWIRYAVEKGVMISINPDAHKASGFYDMYYGVCVARKGMLTADFTFNALELAAVSEKFKSKKR